LLESGDAWTVQRQFSCDEEAQMPRVMLQNRLVIAALMWEGDSTECALAWPRAGDEIEAGLSELAPLSAELTGKQKRRSAVCRI
jgi:hypothetical protein